MMTSLKPADPLPADPLGKRLCEIFCYRWCALEATVPDDTTAKPIWTTITGYPLRPRVLWNLWQEAKTLIGVRFTHETRYALIDIDAGSPHRNPDKISQIRAALETIGITRTLLLRSSWNGGLHLYIPLPEPVNTFNLAVALKECLKVQGFPVKAGQLEIFPNVKRWGNAACRDFSEYNGHRLPLQPSSGSCLLDDSFNPIDESLKRFFRLWDSAATHQDLDGLKQALAVGRSNHRKRPKRQYQVTQAWRDDLEIEISEGWTGPGQTNHLLKTIACYGVVFEQLQGNALEGYVLRIATSRTGYETYCRHQADIQRRVQAWSRAAESYYWPLGGSSKRQDDSPPPAPGLFNQQLSEAAQERIKATVKQLEQLGQLPAQITARAWAIVQAGQIGMRTLYKNLALWHPHHQPESKGCEIPEPVSDLELLSEPVESAPDPQKAQEIKEFPTSQNTMKGKAAPPAEGGSDPIIFTSGRGVWGDELTFPQVVEPPLPYLDDLTQAFRRQMQRLGWTAAQMIQFIGERFGGRRRADLNEDELVLLLYQLQSIGSS